MENIKKLFGVDLNLLTIFRVLERTRNVTLAAKSLGLSQPAMSHSLSRLRMALGDQLFVKTPKEMVPTPRAIQLAPIVQSILSQIERDVLDSVDFSPQTLERTFQIKTTDFIEAILVPQLLLRLGREAPKVKISVTSTGFSLPREVLEQGKCDIAIGGFFGDLPTGFFQQKLFDDHFKCAVSKKHPRLGASKGMTIDEFCLGRHLLIAPGGDLQSQLDKILLQKRKKRLIVAGCSSYVVSGWILNSTDAILTAPSKLIDVLAQRFELTSLPLPIKIPEISVLQVWHERNHQDLAHQWFRNRVREALQVKPSGHDVIF